MAARLSSAASFRRRASINIQQVPWLGNIPILGNLFKSRSVSTSTQELIFILSPKIIQT